MFQSLISPTRRLVLKTFSPTLFVSHYRPLQPGVTSSSDVASYTEFDPHPSLAGYVYCYWRLTSARVNNCRPFLYRVVPDACIDIFFNLEKMSDVRVMGFSSCFSEFELSGDFDYAGIRFMPAAFAMLFGINASELTQREESAVDVIPDFCCSIAHTLDIQEGSDRLKDIFDHVLLNHLSSSSFSPDQRLLNAISIVLRNKGIVNLSLDLDIGISERQLRRLFESYVGDTPKAFARVIRFQHYLNLAKSQNYDKSIYLDAGYYDQAHFTKEFKSLFGLTPRQALVRSLDLHMPVSRNSS